MGDIDPYQLNTCDFFEEPCKKQNAKPTYEQLETENAKLRTELKAEKDNHLEFLTNISNALRGFNQATRENR
jgi:DNA-dependent RNA polymerase auxiliary subunit epsilon